MNFYFLINFEYKLFKITNGYNLMLVQLFDLIWTDETFIMINVKKKPIRLDTNF